MSQVQHLHYQLQGYRDSVPCLVGLEAHHVSVLHLSSPHLLPTSSIYTGHHAVVLIKTPTSYDSNDSIVASPFGAEGFRSETAATFDHACHLRSDIL